MQVSWCKFEVEVADWKTISAGGQCASRELPPLVVAALNIKTVVDPEV